MNTKRPLTPRFINKLDQLLLKNNPVTWSTRIHLTLYYGLGFTILLTLLCFIVPEDSRSYSSVYNWVILLSVVSLLAFVFWMIYLLRFNVFKRFGKWGNFDTVKTFLFYFLIILLIISWPFIPPIVQSVRANASYTSDELVKDVNDINYKLCLLERDSIDTRFASDTFQVKDSVTGGLEQRTVIHTAEDNKVYTDYTADYYYIDTVILADKLKTADSIKRINDSVYVFYECPNYTFVSNYDIREKSNIPLLSSFDLYKMALVSSQPVNRGELEKELLALFKKYDPLYKTRGVAVSNFDYSTNNDETDYFRRIRDRYDLYYISRNIDNITGKKYRWDEDTIDACWRTAYYITLALAILVLIYRHSTRKTFFLSLLSAVVLSILTGLFMAAAGSQENGFYTWLIVYFVLFASLSAIIISSRHRNVVWGISLNLLVFMTPFMPLVITASYYEFLRREYLYRVFSRPGGVNYDHLFINESLHYFLAETGGFVLLLILLITLYRAAYRKWYSSPEQ